MKRALAAPLLLLASCMPDVTAQKPAGASVVALFDPLPASGPPIVPAPNDLAFQGGDGVHLNVPIDPKSPAAAQDFNAYLNSLDGFPGSLDATSTFSGALDPASATGPGANGAGSVIVVDLKAGRVLQASELGIKVSADGKTLTITPAKRFAPGGKYAVALFGGSDPAALKGAAGETVLAGPAFFFIRSDKPLVGKCGDGTTPDCACPPAVIAAVSGGAMPDMTCKPLAQGLDLTTALKTEGARLSLAPAVAQVLSLAGAGRSRDNLALLWTFTITTSPVAMFDPARGDVPFPNDVLINQTTNTVNVPIAAGDPMAPIKMQLNQLDGFSTTAAETVSIDTVGNLPIDTASPGTSALLANITANTINVQPPFTAAPVMVMGGTQYTGQVAVAPGTALLSDQNKYAVVITTDAKDSAGRAVVPSPPIQLAKGANPLFDGTHSTVPSILDDATAQQLESLRLAYQPLFALLGSSTFNVPKEKIAMIWTFTTQSVNRPLNALATFPTTAALPTAATIGATATLADLVAAAPSMNYDISNLGEVVSGTFQSQDVIDHAAGRMTFDRTVVTPGNLPQDTFAVHPPAAAQPTTVKFVLALPKGPGPFPIAIVQHGLTEWRGQAMLLANALAAQGWATVAIDVNYHGARSICTADNQCMGTCSMTTHTCSGGFVPTPTSMDPFACTLDQIFPSDPD